MAALLMDIEASEDNFFKQPMKNRIDKMLGSFTVNMDPSNYRRLYRDKAFREALALPSASERASGQISNNSTFNFGAAAANTSNIGHSSLYESKSSDVNHYKVRASVDVGKLGSEKLLSQSTAGGGTGPRLGHSKTFMLE